MALRMSFTPANTADKAINSQLKALAVKRAKVVFPTPGGPHSIIECGLPEAKASCSGLPLASKWLCPITSAIVRGRSCSAKGVWLERDANKSSVT